VKNNNYNFDILNFYFLLIVSRTSTNDDSKTYSISTTTTNPTTTTATTTDTRTKSTTACKTTFRYHTLYIILLGVLLYFIGFAAKLVTQVGGGIHAGVQQGVQQNPGLVPQQPRPPVGQPQPRAMILIFHFFIFFLFPYLDSIVSFFFSLI
jgi:hypothetical protein